MVKMNLFIAFFLLLGSVLWADSSSQSVMFDPPSGWKLADPKQLPPYVEVMVVGESSGNYPPSLNVGIEDFEGTLKDYLKIVKKINEAHNSPWKSLGTIETIAGKADLSTVDIQTSWGPVRLVHVILVEEGKAIILTGAAKREEFTAMYPTFLKSMRTLRIGGVKGGKAALALEKAISSPCCANAAGSTAHKTFKSPS